MTRETAVEGQNRGCAARGDSGQQQHHGGREEESARIFDLLLKVANVLSEAASIANQATSDSIKLNFGDIDVTPDASNPSMPFPVPTLADAAVTTTQKGTTNPQGPFAKTSKGVDIPGSGIPVIKNYLEELGEMGIFFPILRLSNLVQLIVGNDTDSSDRFTPSSRSRKFSIRTLRCLGVDWGTLSALTWPLLWGRIYFFGAHRWRFRYDGPSQWKIRRRILFGDFDPNSTGSAMDRSTRTSKERPEVSFTGFVQAGVVGQAEVLGFGIGKLEGYFQVGAEISVDLNDDNEIDGVAPPCDTRTVEERHDENCISVKSPTFVKATTANAFDFGIERLLLCGNSVSTLRFLAVLFSISSSSSDLIS